MLHVSAIAFKRCAEVPSPCEVPSRVSLLTLIAKGRLYVHIYILTLFARRHYNNTTTVFILVEYV